jgi:S1-C subfamily serine protease
MLDVHGVRLAALGVVTALTAGVAANATGAPSRTRVSPETFARVASGVGLLRVSPDCKGTRSGYATAFLVSPKVIVTANHAIGSSSVYRACRIQVRLSGRWYETAFAKAWYDTRTKVRHVDLATLKLTRPAPGYVFGFARELPRPGNTVATIGHPRGLPLSFHQGLFRKGLVTEGVPIVVAHMVAEGGNSGGPIINRDGEVVGIVQRVAYTDEDPVEGRNFVAGLNLAAWFGASDAADLCRAYPNGGIPTCEAGATHPARRLWVSLRPPPG